MRFNLKRVDARAGIKVANLCVINVSFPHQLPHGTRSHRGSTAPVRPLRDRVAPCLPPCSLSSLPSPSLAGSLGVLAEALLAGAAEVLEALLAEVLVEEV